jgi:RNA polymerase sigma-70 factor (ECF subfamily)
MREKLEPQINLPGYLLIMVKNKCLNHLQHIKVQIKAEEHLQNNMMRELGLRQALLTACNPEEMFHSDIQRIINETLDTVSPQCRRVISMSRFDGLSNKQIAAQLNISVKGVEFQITKGLKALRMNLKDYLSFFVFLLIRSLY